MGIVKDCVCKRCGREYTYQRGTGHTLSYCNSCMVNTRRFALRKKVWDYVGRVCSICGYDKNINVLEFHHLNPGLKDFTISGSHCRKWEAMKNEIDKCIVVCSNCHRELHNPDDSNLR